MLKYISSFFLFFLAVYSAYAQILPKEGRMLNYRLIGFSCPAGDKAKDYTIEIAYGNYDMPTTFQGRIKQVVHSKSNRTIIEVPQWGAQYTWRSSYVAGGHKTTSGLYHFSTGSLPDTNTRLRITDSAQKYEAAYVLLDGTAMMYDMKGNAVWYMPDIEGLNAEARETRDLKCSSEGTITFLLRNRAYEINYDGDILWRGPGNNTLADSEGIYHHEFTRLNTGHYMVLGNEFVSWKIAQDNSKSDSVARDSVSHQNEFGTVLEYDTAGRVVWTWHSADYFRNSDLKPLWDSEEGAAADAHENSFYFDEKNKMIYVGFRNLSRIVKVLYPTGDIAGAYGTVYKPGSKNLDNGMYCNQHSCKSDRDGNIYLYNNNTCVSGSVPSVMRLGQTAIGDGQLKVQWEYVCTKCGPAVKYKGKFNAGGNVMELSNKNMFVSMCLGYGNLFIVSPAKKILWGAIAEKRDTITGKWGAIMQYRSSIIDNDKQLRRLVTNAAS